MKYSLLSAAVAGFLSLAAAAAPALAAGGAEHPKKGDYSFDGPMGRFDQAQLQRGYKVYREVCSSCHSMNLISFRHLGIPGAPFYDPDSKNPNDNPYVRTIAAEFQIPDIDSETGDVVQRPGTPADRFPNPYPNEAAGRGANGGALPPDLSVMAKARHGGADYIYSLLSGYVAPPKGLTVPANQYYNPYYAGDVSAFWAGDHEKTPKGGFLAMPPQLKPGLVTFDDGTPPTIKNQARDVGAFIMWASEPKMEERKRTGLAVLGYLTILAGLLYASYRKIWRDVAH
jgi:ubiquinol-cytochrome c reductase cytochrome c1 subunit